MRLAAIACALVIIMCVAVFGAILSQRSPAVPIPTTSPAQAATEGSSRTVVTTVEEERVTPPLAASAINPPAPEPAPAAPIVVSQNSPAPAAPAAPAAPPVQASAA